MSTSKLLFGGDGESDDSALDRGKMNLRDIAWSSLRRRSGKMVLMIFGLGIAVATVIGLLEISAAMQADITSKLDEYGANILIVPRSEQLSLSYGGLTVSDVSVDVPPLKGEDAENIRRIRNRNNIKIVAPKLLQAATILKRKALVVGVEFANERNMKKWWKVNGHIPSGRREALLGAEASSLLGRGLNQTFGLKGHEYRVAGVLDPTGSQDDGAIFIDLQEAQALFNRKDQLSMIEVAALCSDCPIEEIVRQTSEKLPAARVVAVRQTIESKMETVHRFEKFSWGVSAIVVLIAALMVWTTVTASVNERTREIGIFRSMGFRRSHVLKIILTELFVISSVAGLLGYAVGLASSTMAGPLLADIAVPGSFVRLPLLGLAVGLSVLIAGLAGAVPAIRAAQLEPTEALKSL